jgi:membrane-associated phospholipid phosphatase
MSKKVCADGLLAELTAADKDLAAAYDIVQSGIYTREHERDEEEVKTGWWCEGGCVDRLDKALSMPLFTLELPVALEIAWSAPGAWFGVPVIAQGVAPLVIAGASRSAATRSLSCPHCTATASNVFRPLFLPSLSPSLSSLVAVVDHCAKDSQSVPWTESPLVRFALAPVVLALLVWWTILVRQMLGMTTRTDFKQRRGIRAAYQMFDSKGMTLLLTLAAPHLALLCTSLWAGPHGHTAAAFYSIAWALAVTPSEMLKSVFKRQRPAFCLREELAEGTVYRRLGQMQSLLRSRETRHKSFPSGDAAGAMAFCSSGVLITCSSLFAHADVAAAVNALLHPESGSGASSGVAQAALPLVAKLASTPPFLFFSACAVLSASGRMFFHAHHFVDVAMGQLCALGTTMVLWGLTEGSVTWMNAVYVHIAVICFFFAMERRLPSAPMKKKEKKEKEG